MPQTPGHSFPVKKAGQLRQPNRKNILIISHIFWQNEPKRIRWGAARLGLAVKTVAGSLRPISFNVRCAFRLGYICNTCGKDSIGEKI
jgi:hypothetical protein